jgi:hypothetical protein
VSHEQIALRTRQGERLITMPMSVACVPGRRSDLTIGTRLTNWRGFAGCTTLAGRLCHAPESDRNGGANSAHRANSATQRDQSDRDATTRKLLMAIALHCSSRKDYRCRNGFVVRDGPAGCARKHEQSDHNSDGDREQDPQHSAKWRRNIPVDAAVRADQSIGNGRSRALLP